MITDTLKDRKPGDKPRFFLHDEMKEWLKDNLKFDVTALNRGGTNITLQQKLGLSAPFLVETEIHITLDLAGDSLEHHKVVINTASYHKAFETLANVAENCMVHINQLHEENQQLKRRIELLENPLPL